MCYGEWYPWRTPETVRLLQYLVTVMGARHPWLKEALT